MMSLKLHYFIRYLDVYWKIFRINWLSLWVLLWVGGCGQVAGRMWVYWQCSHVMWEWGTQDLFYYDITFYCDLSISWWWKSIHISLQSRLTPHWQGSHIFLNPFRIPLDTRLYFLSQHLKPILALAYTIESASTIDIQKNLA